MEQTLPTGTEDDPDPQDFYAPDSPVEAEFFDSGQVHQDPDLEAQDDDQVESIIACHVWLSYLTYISDYGAKDSQQPQAQLRQSLFSRPQSPSPPLQNTRQQNAGPSPSRETLPLWPPTIPVALPSHHDGPSASQHQDVAFGGYSTRPMSLDRALRPPTIPVALPSRRDGPSVSQHQDVASGSYSTRPMSLDRAQRRNIDRKRRGRSPQRHGLEDLKLAVSLELILVFLC